MMKKERTTTAVLPAPNGKFRWVNRQYRDGIMVKIEWATRLYDSEAEAKENAENAKLGLPFS